MTQGIERVFMGFGLLFTGYFMAQLMSVHSYGFLIELFGYALIAVSCVKLRRYNDAFGYPLVGAILMSLCSVTTLAIALWNFLYDSLIISIPLVSFLENDSLLMHIGMLSEIFFHASLLIAVRRISRETEVEKTAYASVRNLIFLAVYYVMFYIAYIPFEAREDYIRAFGLPTILVYYVCVVLNLILFFNCYARICDESDVNMERKPSRFDFINRLREESDRREKKAIDSTNEYIEKKKAEREARRKKK